MKKLGRNEPCPCGSGLKYKKCCLYKNMYDKFGEMIPPQAVLEAARQFKDLPPEPFEKGGFLTGRKFIDIIFKGKRIRAVGSGIYKRDINETFHQFILSLFMHAIDYGWYLEERKKPLNEQNLIVQWFGEIDEKMSRSKDQTLPIDFVFWFKQTGNIRSLLAMAYDYYSLRHCSVTIPDDLINRLKNKDNFQGAKYELSVGAIAVRSGFKIEWITAKDKHGEFKGEHNITGDIAIFEAKSHHREGVLGRGIESSIKESELKITKHIHEALDQSDKKLPLIIFDDINLPITPEIEMHEKKWFQRLDSLLKKNKFLDNYKSTNFGALITTNFSWHFHQDLDKIKENEVMAIFHVGGQFSLDPRTINLLKIASEQYGFVPARLDERDAK